MQKKKIPMRMCLGCNEMKPKIELIRIVKTPENEIMVDLKGKANGRGAYICRDAECLKKAVKAKRLERTFATEISDEIYETLKKDLTDEQ
ncbi:MAG: YlxR family protein [Ruminococcaceae bacterium]|nr:YlxR family protein [Oscillospiraceae bacterium]